MVNNKILNISYWEQKQYFRQWDLIVIGGGIVGLSTAICFTENNPDASVLVLERGTLPTGASTKNAGFACFGTAGEILDDLSHMEADIVWQTVKMRWDGLQMLRARLSDAEMSFECIGGYELFFNENEFRKVIEKIPLLNAEIEKTCGLSSCYETTEAWTQRFPGVKGVIVNRYEGQLDTGRMMDSLFRLAIKKNITILYGVNVSRLQEKERFVEINSSLGDFTGLKVVAAINGFARQLLEIEDVNPARAQVLVTTPIANLDIAGTFHFEKGFYYFRNVNGRILFGGGRNLDIPGETTTDNQLNTMIQKQLENLLRERILPGSDFRIERRWTGIMGVGSEKLPVIRKSGKRVVAALRMGGMGVAIGSLVGQRAAILAAS